MCASETGSTAARLKEEARRLGASRVGICAAGELPHRREFLDWVATGKHGSMAYMARDPERRTDPRASFPAARSIIVIAVDHEREIRRQAGLTARVARYALGRDYHEVLGEILESLSRLVESLGGHCRSCVDTAPILERELGMAAGLGFIGKNACLIHERAGSYFALGELLTDLALPSDAPSTPRCGTCRRCLDACPTGALVAPYVLDSRRCLSYWTIEHRGAIPRTLHRAMGDRIFGCDTCQEVCPWNRKAKAMPHPDLTASENRVLDVDVLCGASSQELRNLFRDSAIGRAKRQGLLRNIAIALGNSAVSSARRHLACLLTDDDAVVRRHAALALARALLRKRRSLGARLR